MTVQNAEGDCEFRAQRTTGQSSQEVVATTTGGAKVYRTVGKRPQIVAHLTASADAADPYADMQAQLDRMTAKAAPQSKATRRKASRRDRVLMDEEGVSARLCPDGHVAIAIDIDLAKTASPTTEVIRIVQRLSMCFLSNQTYIQPYLSKQP